MNKNPYDVLGISPNASDDEVKRAYRDLTRKYHPDANVNNPLADLAEEKFKEVQEAYDIIMKQREQGGYSYGYGSQGGSYQSYGNQSSRAQQNPQMQAVYNYLNTRHFREALNVLNGMPNRTAEWYYLSAAANAGIGNNIMARDHAGQAVNMEPNNLQYRQLLNQLEWSGQKYQNYPYGGGYGMGAVPVVQEICAAICVSQINCVNVWEEIFAHAYKGKKSGFRRSAFSTDCYLHGARKYH